MAQRPHSSSFTVIIAMVIALLLMVIIWPLSMMGKGRSTTGDTDEADLRIQPVAKLEMAGGGEIRWQGA
jgi:hypothetical protein